MLLNTQNKKLLERSNCIISEIFGERVNWSFQIKENSRIEKFKFVHLFELFTKFWNVFLVVFWNQKLASTYIPRKDFLVEFN